MKILFAVIRDPDVFITIYDEEAGGGGDPYTAPVEENYSVSAGENELTHSAGWQPKRISIKINDASPQIDDYFANWFVNLCDNPTTKIFVNFDQAYTDVDITFYKD
jgi:hypothetical protein